MNLKEWRLIFLTIYFLVVVGIFYPVARPLIKGAEGSFLSMAILGNNDSTGDYFYSDESTINPGEEVNWKIRIHNGLKDAVYVSIKVKLAEQKAPSPNTDTCTPSDAPTIYEINKVLIKSEKVYVSFTWEIGEIEVIDDENVITSLVVNDKMVKTDVDLNEDLRAKLIFEAWIYDIETNQLEFTIDNGKEEQCIWNQINFKIGN